MNQNKEQKDLKKIGKEPNIEKKNYKQSVHPGFRSQLIVKLLQL